MKIRHILFGMLTMLYVSCVNVLDDGVLLSSKGADLSIHVLAEQPESSKALITDTYLPSGSAIGITVLNTSGSNYDGTAYSNIKFTSSGTSTSQTWAGASTVKLSATEGYCYAYYPYSSSASSITAIPVTAGSTDYLYATKQSVNDKSKTATLPMKHALSAIRFALKRGTYAGTGKVTAVSVASSALGSSGTLNATTGAVTASNKGTAVSQSANLTLSTTAQNVDVVMVPSGTAGSITLSVTIDGKPYSTTVSSTTIAQGSCYTYTLTVNAGALALSGVQVGAWGYNSAGAPTITAAGYTVTFAGDYSGVAFENSVSGSTVTIKAIGLPNCTINEVTKTGTATLTQSVSRKVRTITLSGIASNVTVTFNGIHPWGCLSDGVYAIKSDGTPVAYASATASSYAGVGFVLLGRPYQLSKTYATGTGSSQKTYWQKTGSSDIAGITNYASVDGVHGTDGYLYGSDTPQLAKDPEVWTQGALSDFNGKANTGYVMAAQNNGATDYTIGKAVANFNSNSTYNQGYTDWFIPSLGELAYMFLKRSELGTLLSKVSGSSFSSGWHWSSTEYTATAVWFVVFPQGFVGYNGKAADTYYVRLIREI